SLALQMSQNSCILIFNQNSFLSDVISRKLINDNFSLAFGGGHDVVPKEATAEDIAGFKRAFVDSAKRALVAGFEIIELHFAHGYLMQTFLSPYSNKRTDQYGGSFENRTRLALEIVREVRKEALPSPDYPLWVRISCTDNLPEGLGWDMQQSIEFAKLLKQEGVHLVDCSYGLNAYYAKSLLVNKTIDQVALGAEIQAKAGVATGAVGGIVNAHWAERILREGKATLVL